MADRMPSIPFKDAKLLPGQFRNFSGRQGLYNDEGQKSFCMLLSDEDAHAMAEDGWNVKFTKPREDDDEPKPYLQVAVSFKTRPPRIVLVTSGGNSNLDEVSCSLIDTADIKTVDLVINPSRWDNPNPKGPNLKAYLRSMYVTLDESGDPFMSQYMSAPTTDLPEEFGND